MEAEEAEEPKRGKVVEPAMRASMTSEGSPRPPTVFMVSLCV